ncbi:MAG: tetratricopeptide repeat protein [Elusimicrobiota bacterium]
MNCFKKFTSVMMLTALFVSSQVVHAEPSNLDSNPFNITPEMDHEIKAGLRELYSLEFDKALQIFEPLQGQAEKHPMVAFGLASVHWWRLSVFVLENDEKESKTFLETANKCVELSKKIIKEGDQTGEAHLTLGSVYGLLGRWEATNRNWFTAYLRGKAARKNLSRAIEINPQMVDAYMGLGIFDYYVATLPKVLRILTFLKSENPQVGLNELKIASEKGVYTRIAARFFLAGILSGMEKKPQEALHVLQDLRTEFPMSPFVQIVILTTLYNTTDIGAFQKEAQGFLDKIESKNISSFFKCHAHFFKGMSYFKQKKWSDAEGEFKQAIVNGNEYIPFYTWSHLYQGYSLDAQGKRAEALVLYKKVKGFRRRWRSQEFADDRIKKPFQSTDPEMDTLLL